MVRTYTSISSRSPHLTLSSQRWSGGSHKPPTKSVGHRWSVNSRTPSAMGDLRSARYQFASQLRSITGGFAYATSVGARFQLHFLTEGRASLMSYRITDVWVVSVFGLFHLRPFSGAKKATLLIGLVCISHAAGIKNGIRAASPSHKSQYAHRIFLALVGRRTKSTRPAGIDQKHIPRQRMVG